MSNSPIESSLSALFIPCYYDGLPRNSGSARIRAEWVVRYWDNARVYHRAQPLTGYDLYVFQKAYLVDQTQKWIRAVAKWRDQGLAKLAFDLCDPDFLEEEHKRRLLKVLPLFDFAVATTEPIKEWLEQWLPTYMIPDRVDLAEIVEIRKSAPGKVSHHRVRHTPGMPRAAWSGYQYNMSALEILTPTIDRLGLDVALLTVDRKPLPFNEFWHNVMEYDLLLNPRPDVPAFNHKSDNKTLIAWALGMPVARTPEELERLCDPTERVAEVRRREIETIQKWDVRLSVEQWKATVSEQWGGSNEWQQSSK